MKAIATLLSLKNDVLLIAPPAWGKTRLLIELIADSGDQWIFISPLRALANEFYEVMNSVTPECYLISRKTQMQQLKGFKLLIVTPEVCNLSLLENYPHAKFIFDEFHLIYYWGDSFRFHLIELYHWCTNQKFVKLLLTATMSSENLMRLSSELPGIFMINVGNQQLKNLPSKMYGYLTWQKKMMQDNILMQAYVNEGTVLVFCKYRQEVWLWLKWFYQLEIPALGCVGGSSSEFQELLKQRPETRVIVTTSALSHGVNLPKINHIFLLYQLSNKDFWIQMVGRGGRKGEAFTVHTMDFYEEYGRKYFMLLSSLFLWIKSKIKMEWP